jgi:hypothetical protein
MTTYGTYGSATPPPMSLARASRWRDPAQRGLILLFLSFQILTRACVCMDRGGGVGVSKVTKGKT